MQQLDKLSNAMEEMTQAVRDVQDSQVRLEDRVTKMECQWQCQWQHDEEAGWTKFYELSPRGTQQEETTGN